MNTPLQFKVFDRQQIVYEGEFAGTVQLGRQNELSGGEAEDVYKARRLNAKQWRLVIARYDENNVSREHALIEPLNGSRVKVTNLSAKLPVPIQLPIERILPQLRRGEGDQSSQILDVPCIFHLGPKTIRIQELESEDGAILQSLSEVTRPPGRLSSARSDQIRRLREPDPSQNGGPAVDPETLVRWLQSTIDVLQDAASATDFFQRAAEAMVQNVGLDNGWVLEWDPGRGDWAERAVSCCSDRPEASTRRPSQRFLDRVRETRTTTWRVPEGGSMDSGHSLIDVKVVVAAPIVNPDGEVTHALYGDRRQGADGASQFSKLEALLVELLAGGVAAGLARLAQEQQAARARGQFELFFGGALADELKRQPDLMEGRESVITVLFADIRNFSGVSDALGHKATFDWINFVMDTLSKCVIDHDGLVVDYIGDALMAMWGAPKHDPEHAIKACRAALDMLDAVPGINERTRLPKPMGLGVGINTGSAEIGNTGSNLRFKYGPLGPTVNLASRVEGATKYLKSGVIATESTMRLIGDALHARKLCSARVVNIPEPVDLYELADPERFEGDWFDLSDRYANALAEFEQARPDDREQSDHQFRRAARTLGNLLTDYPLDGPSLILMKRAVGGMIEGPEPEHPVWQLPGK